MADQEIARLIIRLVGEVTDLKKQLQDVKSSVRDFSEDAKKQGEGFTRSLAGIKTSYLKMVGEIYVAYRAFTTAMRWAEIGAQAESVEESFSLMTKSIGVNGDLLMQKLQETGYVFVNTSDLMIKAMRLLDVGVKWQEIVKLMESARVASRFMGTTVGEAFDRISESLITLRTVGIKRAFPIDIEVLIKKYADSLNLVKDLIDDAGKRQALLNEIFRLAQERLRLLGGELHPTTSEKLQKIRSSIDLLKEDIGKGLLPILGALGTAFYNVSAGVTYLVYGLLKWRQVHQELMKLSMSLFPEEVRKEAARLAEDYRIAAEDTLKIAKDLKSKATVLASETFDAWQSMYDKMATKKIPSPFVVDPTKTRDDLDESGVIISEFNKRQSEIILGLRTKAAESEKALVEATAEKTRAIAISATVRRGEDTFNLEHEYAIKKANDTHEVALEALSAQMIEEENQIKTKIGSVTPKIRTELDSKYYKLRQVETAKSAAEIANLETKYFVESRGRQLDIDDAATKIEISNEKAVLAAAEDLYAKHLIKAKAFYEVKSDVMMATGTDEIKMLQDRLDLDVKLTDPEREKLRAEIVEKTNALESDLNALKREGYQTVQEELNAETDLLRVSIECQNVQVSMAREKFEITEAQGLAMRISFQKILLSDLETQLALTDEIRDPKKYADLLLAIQQVNAEIQTMNKSLEEQTGTFIEGWEEGIREAIDKTKTAFQMGKDAVKDFVDVGTNSVGNFFDKLIDGTTSARDAIRELPMEFSRAVLKMIVDIGMLILEMMIFRALAAATGLERGGKAGATFPVPTPGQGGGRVIGPSGTDRVRANLTAGEWVIKEKAVQFYGDSFMSAINDLLVPRPSFNFTYGGPVSSVFRDEGGESRGEGGPINIVNILDNRMMDLWLASASGKDSFLNFISANAGSIKRRLR